MGGRTGHGVVGVGQAVLGAGLAGDEGGEGLVTDARRAEGVEVAGDAGLAHVGDGQRGHGAAERVAGHDDAVRRVGGHERPGRRHDGALDVGPGRQEAGVGLAARREVAARVHEEEQVGDPVPDRLGPAERDHDEAPGRVCGDESLVLDAVLPLGRKRKKCQPRRSRPSAAVLEQAGVSGTHSSVARTTARSAVTSGQSLPEHEMTVPVATSPLQ